MNTSVLSRIDIISNFLNRDLTRDLLRILDEKFPDLDDIIASLPTDLFRDFVASVNEFLDEYIYSCNRERDYACAYTHNPNHFNINARLRYEYCDHEETTADYDAMIDYFCGAIFD